MTRIECVVPIGRSQRGPFRLRYVQANPNRANSEYIRRSWHDQARGLYLGIPRPCLLRHVLLFDKAADEIEKRARVLDLGLARTSRGLLHAPEHDGCVTFERRACVTGRFCDQRLQRAGESIGRQRCGPMLVDHPTRRGFEGRRQRRSRIRDVEIDQRLQLRRSIPREPAGQREEELGLTLVEVPCSVEERADVTLLLSNDNGRRMLARSHQVRAVGGTLNFNEPLGPAADRANLVSEGWTRPPCFAATAQRTNHIRSIV
jgi:hypothetical protein